MDSIVIGNQVTTKNALTVLANFFQEIGKDNCPYVRFNVSNRNKNPTRGVTINNNQLRQLLSNTKKIQERFPEPPARMTDRR